MAKYTLLKEVSALQTEAEAYEFMEQFRWGDIPRCAHCDSRRVYFLTPKDGTASRSTRTGSRSERRVWKCGECRKQFSVTTNTIFHGSKVSLKTWLMVVSEMCASKNGVAAREIERKYGVAPKTAWHMAHRVREAMKSRSPESLVGTIVADETFIGGDPRRMNKKARARWEGENAEPTPVRPGAARPNQRSAKTPVLSLVDAKTGEVRSRAVPDVTGATLRKAIAQQVDMSRSTLWTDEARTYKAIGEEFAADQTVNHADDEYVDYATGATTNKAENFFSQLKRSIDGTHHHVSRKHLDRYLGEFDFRYTHRKVSDETRAWTLMGQVGDRRLTYFRTKGA